MFYFKCFCFKMQYDYEIRPNFRMSVICQLDKVNREAVHKESGRNYHTVEAFHGQNGFIG